MVEQRDVHATKKDFKMEKFGSILDLADTVGSATHVKMLFMTIEDLASTDPHSILSQCHQRILTLYKVPLVASWASKLLDKHPQLPLFAARAFEHNMVKLSEGVDHHETKSRIRAKDYSNIDKQAYIDLVQFTKGHCDKILGLARQDAYLQDIPRIVPTKSTLPRSC